LSAKVWPARSLNDIPGINPSKGPASGSAIRQTAEAAARDFRRVGVYNREPSDFMPLFLLLLVLACQPAAFSEIVCPSDPGQARTQNPAQAGQPIRVSTNLVQVPVSVTDAEGNPVKDLTLEDFVIEENGNPVTIEHMGEPGESRLELILVFDVTGSVFSRFEFEQQAATAFLKRIFRSGDAAAVLCIGLEPKVVLERTTSIDKALEGLGELQPSGDSTAFYDSVIAAARMLRTSADPETRRAQIVLSDGEDNRSDNLLTDAIREVQQADCIFYSINPGGVSIRLNKVSQRGQQGMESLAQQTGGAAFLAEKLEDLERIFNRIAAELQAQYLLSYYSPDSRTDGGFRPIKVRVPNKPELRVRARQGYYAARSSIRRTR
jgi:Ca-activated chloride channel family protein